MDWDSLALTIASFWAAATSLVYAPAVPMLLAALAIAQMGVHVAFFLHISRAPEQANNFLALAFGVFVTGDGRVDMRLAILMMCSVVTAGVFAAMFLAIWSARRKNSPPPFFRQNLAAELVWAAIPCLIILAAAIPAAIAISCH